MEAVKSCKTVYLEAYTSILLAPKEKLVRRFKLRMKIQSSLLSVQIMFNLLSAQEDFYGKEVVLADREFVEMV